MSFLNPLFEREWRGRFRRSSSYLQLFLAAVTMTAIVCFGVWQGDLAPALTIVKWRAHGLALLNIYRLLGAFVFWGAGLLVGAASVADEKASATWEDLLMCPMGGRGLAVGKIASCAAWVMLLQIVSLPPLIVAGVCFGAKPLEIGGVMLSHLLLTVQGTTLGFWGASRGRSLAEGVLLSLTGLWRLLLHCVLFIMVAVGALLLSAGVFGLIAFIRVPTIASFMRALFFFVFSDLVPTIGHLIPVLLGVTGFWVPVGAISAIGNQLPFPLVLLGQLVSIALVLKCSAWQVDHPTHDLWVGTFAEGESRWRYWRYLVVLYAAWSWTLKPEQLDAFYFYEDESAEGTEFHPLASQLLARRNSEAQKRGGSPPGEAVRRWRLPITRELMRLNPVLWLDLTRVLSLRAPESVILPVAVIATVLGGWLLLDSISIVMGWVYSAQFGSAGDKIALQAGWHELRRVLLIGALAGGPLLGAQGCVVERRSELLLELRLTLLSAGAMVCGKFVARFIALGLCSLPLLALVTFFAFNWPWKNGVGETVVTVLSTLLLAAWSLLACLCISDVCRKELTAILWCVAFAVAWGVLIWQFPDVLWNISHLIGAVIAGLTLFWRLKRLGFS